MEKNINNSGATHYAFNSVQTHMSVINGKKSETTEAVSVRNGRGSKTVSRRVNGKAMKKTIPLTHKEVQNIKDRKFMPEFFIPCYDCINNKETRKIKKSKMRKVKKSLKKGSK
jgi:hypothetical protein